jgi:hypothetical protein
MKTCCNSRITVPLMAIASSITLSAFTQTANSRKPFNVLFIASDDMNSDLNAFGNPAVHTPNIDRLAKMGIIFNNAYNQANNPDYKDLVSKLSEVLHSSYMAN